MSIDIRKRLILHGTWVPANCAKTAGALALWGETESATSEGMHKVGSVPTYPWGATPEQLATLLQTEGQCAVVVLWLPGLDGIPQRSPQLVGTIGEEAEVPGKLILSPWTVPVLLVSPIPALKLLIRLSEGETQRDLYLAPDLHHWGQAGKFVLDLLVREKILPSLTHDHDEYAAEWEPFLIGNTDPQHLKELTTHLPPVARTMCGCLTSTGFQDWPMETNPDGTWSQPKWRSAQGMIQGFIRDMVHQTIHEWLGNGEWSSIRRTRGTVMPLALQWAEALRSTHGILGADPLELRALKGRVDDWLTKLTAESATDYRTCFRLSEPRDSVDEQGDPDSLLDHIDRPDELWSLCFYLQALDDPSLLVPAEEVWAEFGPNLVHLNRQFEAPQERLLTDLARAARFFPPLSESLRQLCPKECRLTTAQAYHFMREAATALEEVGMGVHVPPWWDRTRGGQRRMGVKLSMNPVSQTESSMGLNTLVDFNWQLALGDELLEQDEFERLAALKVPLVKIRGEWVELQPEQVEQAIRYWERRRERKRMTAGEALRLGWDGETGRLDVPVVSVEAGGWLDELRQTLAAGEQLEELPTPQGFQGLLRPYQVRGFSWMNFLKKWGIGACLADDMGLGKTIQLIALLLAGRETGENQGPALLLCPTSVVGNWAREITRFGPALEIQIHHGPNRLGGEAFQEVVKVSDLVITTYALVHRDIETLAQIDWDGIILDEAQNIKNAETKQARAVRSLPARYRVALTGTPVENRLAELWSIMEFLNPGFLGSAADFQTRFAVPIERYKNRNVAQRLHSLVQPFILRRLKTDPKIIQDLPEKQEMKVYCPLTREQATLYEATVREMLNRIETSSGMERRGAVLATLTKLKQICNHPVHFLKDGGSLRGRSGKLARLGEMLEEVVAEGDRALVFTQFAEMGELLRPYLRERLSREVLFLHGGVPQHSRDQLVTRFQEEENGPPVLILSLKAGGVGLNLTRANHVFHFDRWWNPAVENQATDRAFRIGQTRNVQVHKFICSGTLEERIDELIERKRTLAEGIIGSGENWLTEMSSSDLRSLFALRADLLEEEVD